MILNTECSIKDVKQYVQMRIEQTDRNIAAEKLSGNKSKLLAESSAKSELIGLMEFIQK